MDQNVTIRDAQGHVFPVMGKRFCDSFIVTIMTRNGAGWSESSSLMGNIPPLADISTVAYGMTRDAGNGSTRLTTTVSKVRVVRFYDSSRGKYFLYAYFQFPMSSDLGPYLLSNVC